jgi:hypothetical protein
MILEIVASRAIQHSHLAQWRITGEKKSMKIICLYGVCVLHLYTLKNNTMTQIKLGTSVRVSDPCYTDDVWCKTKLTNVKEGNYEVYVEHIESYGRRVSKLQVVHEDFKHLRHDNFNWEEHSEIGVDSGQAGIFCESSYRNDEFAKDIVTPMGDWLGFPMEEKQEGDVFYDKMCAFTINGDGRWGSYESGVVTSSGYGDGGYPLEVIEKDGTIVAMKITFIDDGEDEEEEEEEYEENEY